MSKKSGGENAAVVQNENIARMQMSWEISEMVVFYCASLAVKHQHSRSRTISERLLCDEFRRKVKVEVGDEHGVSGTECIESVARY